MLKNVSWNNYIIVVVLLMVVWYLFVALRYYYSDIIDYINRKRILQFRVIDEEILQESPDSSYEKLDQESSSESYLAASDTISDEIEIFTTKLKEGIATATQRKLNQDNFKDYIQSFLEEFSTLRNSPLRHSIIELIVSECEKNESTLLTHQQVEDLWHKQN